MKKFFQKHLDIVLIVCAAAFVAVIVVCAMWNIGDLTQQAENAFSEASVHVSPTSFDLKGAAALDLHGLMPANPSPSASPTSSAAQ
jgi:hypothetical protein